MLSVLTVEKNLPTLSTSEVLGGVLNEGLYSILSSRDNGVRQFLPHRPEGYSCTCAPVYPHGDQCLDGWTLRTLCPVREVPNLKGS